MYESQERFLGGYRPHQACNMSENPRNVFFSNKNRLRQGYRPHQAYNMSENLRNAFWPKKTNAYSHVLPNIITYDHILSYNITCAGAVDREFVNI